ncbi:MAG TPA: type II toxin-antitoxin system prevent-host-death family antitoxin [Terriglobales bacterium]|nr:type II toxin-antitoxin system prevent-host-death family antitoxin [Terriglobales bacterium]
MQHGSNNVDAYEAKTHFSQLLERVEAGDQIIITRHGVPVAKLVPVKKQASPEQRAAAITRMQKLGASLSLGRLKIKNLIREGRR